MVAMQEGGEVAAKEEKIRQERLQKFEKKWKEKERRLDADIAEQRNDLDVRKRVSIQIAKDKHKKSLGTFQASSKLKELQRKLESQLCDRDYEKALTTKEQVKELEKQEKENWSVQCDQDLESQLRLLEDKYEEDLVEAENDAVAKRRQFAQSKDAEKERINNNSAAAEADLPKRRVMAPLTNQDPVLRLRTSSSPNFRVGHIASESPEANASRSSLESDDAEEHVLSPSAFLRKAQPFGPSRVNSLPFQFPLPEPGSGTRPAMDRPKTLPGKPPEPGSGTHPAMDRPKTLPNTPGDDRSHQPVVKPSEWQVRVSTPLASTTDPTARTPQAPPPQPFLTPTAHRDTPLQAPPKSDAKSVTFAPASAPISISPPTTSADTTASSPATDAPHPPFGVALTPSTPFSSEYRPPCPSPATPFGAAFMAADRTSSSPETVLSWGSAVTSSTPALPHPVATRFVGDAQEPMPPSAASRNAQADRESGTGIGPGSINLNLNGADGHPPPGGDRDAAYHSRRGAASGDAAFPWQPEPKPTAAGWAGTAPPPRGGGRCEGEAGWREEAPVLSPVAATGVTWARSADPAAKVVQRGDGGGEAGPGEVEEEAGAANGSGGAGVGSDGGGWPAGRGGAEAGGMGVIGGIEEDEDEYAWSPLASEGEYYEAVRGALAELSEGEEEEEEEGLGRMGSGSAPRSNPGWGLAGESGEQGPGILLRAPMSDSNLGGGLRGRRESGSAGAGAGRRGRESRWHRDVLSRSAEWWREMLAARGGSAKSVSLGASMESVSRAAHHRAPTWHGLPVGDSLDGGSSSLGTTFEVQAEYIVPQLDVGGAPAVPLLPVPRSEHPGPQARGTAMRKAHEGRPTVDKKQRSFSGLVAGVRGVGASDKRFAETVSVEEVFSKLTPAGSPSRNHHDAERSGGEDPGGVRCRCGGLLNFGWRAWRGEGVDDKVKRLPSDSVVGEVVLPTQEGARALKWPPEQQAERGQRTESAPTGQQRGELAGSGSAASGGEVRRWHSMPSVVTWLRAGSAAGSCERAGAADRRPESAEGSEEITVALEKSTSDLLGRLQPDLDAGVRSAQPDTDHAAVQAAREAVGTGAFGGSVRSVRSTPSQDSEAERSWLKGLLPRRIPAAARLWPTRRRTEESEISVSESLVPI